MKYRDHKGSLSDSMETEQEVSNIEDIKKHLNKFYNKFGKSVAEIKFEYIGFDERTNWDTYCVLHRLEGENEFKVAGMSDGCIKTDNIKQPKEIALELIERGKQFAIFFFPNERGKESVKLFAIQYALEQVKFLRSRIDEFEFDDNDYKMQRSKWFEVQSEIEKIKNQK